MPCVEDRTSDLHIECYLLQAGFLRGLCLLYVGSLARSLPAMPGLQSHADLTCTQGQRYLAQVSSADRLPVLQAPFGAVRSVVAWAR